MENHNGRLRFTPSASHHRHDSRPVVGGVAHHHVPRELIVSIPLTALYPPAEQEDEPVAAGSATLKHHHHHHKHKKHKKHKKQHQHDATHTEEVHHPAQSVALPEPLPPHLTPSPAPLTVAPLRIHVPKPPSEGRTDAMKRKAHSHHSDRHGQPSHSHDDDLSNVIPSGKHMHTYKHHHHKHKDKRLEHSHKTSYQSTEQVGDELNDQGQRSSIVTPRLPSGKPRSFLMEEERKVLSDDFSRVDKQPHSHEGHRHHKKKKKKHHKHSRHSLSQSEPEVSPTVVRLSDTEADKSQGYVTTPLSTGSKSFTPLSTQETQHPRQDASSSHLLHKETRRLSQEVGLSRSSHKEAQRSSQDAASSSRLPLRRSSQETRTAISQSPELHPPLPKRAKMENFTSPPALGMKFDISQTKELDSEQQQTPSPVSGRVQPALRQPVAKGNTESVSVNITPVTKPMAEARRSSIGEKTHSMMAPPSPLLNPAEMRTPQGGKSLEQYDIRIIDRLSLLVRLSKDTLQLFLKNLHHLIQRYNVCTCTLYVCDVFYLSGRVLEVHVCTQF